MAQQPRLALTMTSRWQGSTWCASPPPAAGTPSLPLRRGRRRRWRERQSQTSSRRLLPLLPGSRVVHPPLRGWRPSRIWTTTTTTSTTSTTMVAASGNIDEEQRLPPSVDGWLLSRPLRRLPLDLSSTAFVIVQSSTLLPLAAVPYRRPSSAAVLSLARDARDDFVMIL